MSSIHDRLAGAFAILQQAIVSGREAHAMSLLENIVRVETARRIADHASLYPYPTAKCNCMTKSPAPKHHDQHCPIRMWHEIMQLNAHIADMEAKQ